MNHEQLPAQSQVSVVLGQLRDWLEQQGFYIEENKLYGQINDCNWYAWRRSKLDTRACDHNGPKIQIVLTPYSYEYGGTRWETVKVDITGKHNGIWYRLQAYSLSPAELMARLDEIETALVSAWNSLRPA